MTAGNVNPIALHARSLSKDGARRAEVRAICQEPLIDYSGASWREWDALAVVAAECAALHDANNSTIPLAELLRAYRPGSYDQPWTWDDEERAIRARVCLCCEQPGHYQAQLEDHIAKHGLTQGVCLGNDGRVWDGHHRIIAARRFGIQVIPVEPCGQADK